MDEVKECITLKVTPETAECTAEKYNSLLMRTGDQYTLHGINQGGTWRDG